MLDWNDYREQLKVGVKEIGQVSPETIKGYLALGGADQKTDLLGAKMRELIVLTVAVSLRSRDQARGNQRRNRGSVRRRHCCRRQNTHLHLWF